MADFIFNTDNLGRSIMVDSNGYLLVSNSAVSGLPYAVGSTGRTVCVDDAGRLMVSVFVASGNALPSPTLYAYGQEFYLPASGFYRKGISKWEK